MGEQFSGADLDRILVLQQIKSRQLKQTEGACLLGLSARQVRRLQKRLDIEGSAGIKRRKSDKGHRSHSKKFKKQVLTKVREKYWDFGPTFASEKLCEEEDLKINKETLRQWMIHEGLWKGKSRRSPSLHQTRQRRSRFGELVQIDGSHHDWFEGRRPKCCLLVFIDDATSKLVSMLFEESETTLGYLRCTQSHIEVYGRPLAYYSDRHSIFRTSRPNSVSGLFEDTQAHRALKELGIELICAYSSQAKGRVERANQTLQDRLIKEMRLRGIATIEEANAYLPTFINAYNKRFSIEAESPEDAHRPVHQSKESLAHILSLHYTRKLSKTLEFAFEGNLFQVQKPGGGYRYQHAHIKLYKHLGGGIEAFYKTEALKILQLDQKSKGPLLADRKDIDRIFDQHILTHIAQPSTSLKDSNPPYL